MRKTHRINTKRLYRILFVAFGALFCGVWFFQMIYHPDAAKRPVFLGDTNDWQMDFFNTIYYIQGRTPYTWGNLAAHNYLPLAYMMLYPFTLLLGDDFASIYEMRYTQIGGFISSVYIVLSFGMLFYFLYKKCDGRLAKAGILAVLFGSGITIYCIDRGNQVTIAAGFLFAFLMTYRSENKLYRHIGYICLAVSAAMKLFPAIFGVLILQEKRWKEACAAILYGLAACFLPFLWLKGGAIENMKFYLIALQEHARIYAGGGIGLLSKTVFGQIPPALSVLPYMIAGLALLLCGAHVREWKKLTLLTLCMLLTSGQQSKYNYVFLFYPFVLFLNDEHPWTDLFYLAFALVVVSPLDGLLPLAPQSGIDHEVFLNTVSVICYLALLIEAVISGARSRRAAEKADSRLDGSGHTAGA